jgi:hypothetical protein
VAPLRQINQAASPSVIVAGVTWAPLGSTICTISRPAARVRTRFGRRASAGHRCRKEGAIFDTDFERRHLKIPNGLITSLGRRMKSSIQGHEVRSFIVLVGGQHVPFPLDIIEAGRLRKISNRYYRRLSRLSA